jgi:acyl-CoA-binding protein
LTRVVRRAENRRTSIEDRKMSADLSTEFEQAASDVKQLPRRPDNDTLLKLYALYKQGAQGDVSGPKPGFFDFVGTAKYEAWTQLRGMPCEEARARYIELVRKLESHT